MGRELYCRSAPSAPIHFDFATLVIKVYSPWTLFLASYLSSLNLSNLCFSTEPGERDGKHTGSRLLSDQRSVVGLHVRPVHPSHQLSGSKRGTVSVLGTAKNQSESCLFQSIVSNLYWHWGVRPLRIIS